MEIMEFCKKVKKSLGIYIGSGASVNIKQVMKNNGIVLHSIMVTEKERNVSPTIYLDGLHEAYEEGETFSKVMEEILQIYEESRMKKNMDMDFFLDYGRMAGQVVYKLIRYESNRELLSQVPYVRFLDMAVVFYCHVPGTGMDNATILIYNSHLELWGITKERLCRDAQKNTRRILPPRLLSIEEMMKEIFVQDLRQKCGESKDDEEWLAQTAGRIMDSLVGDVPRPAMYVLGNKRKLFGAAVILYEGILGEIAEAFGCGYFLLPSSVHEVILIPDDNRHNPEELWNMVCEINATQVAPEDVLTDSVYYFSRRDFSGKGGAVCGSGEKSPGKSGAAPGSGKKDTGKKNAEDKAAKENILWENNGLEKIF